jgi:chitin disaccharide deacetylase
VPLIVNADDFGLTPGVNRSVGELQRARALSSATLMATGSYFDDAVGVARANPGLEVGCHVLLLDGTPALPPSQIPTLCPDGKMFRHTLSGFLRDLFAFRIRASEITAEAVAQVERLQQAGIRVSHFDTHKHTHLFPGILRPLLAAARACGVPAVRNPFEPDWALRVARGSATTLRRLAVVALQSQHRGFQRAVDASGLATTNGTIGVLATGTLDVMATLRGLLDAMPADGGSATWELVSHPGYPDAALDQVRTRLRASRGAEHRALMKLLPGLRLGTWSELHTGSGQRSM